MLKGPKYRLVLMLMSLYLLLFGAYLSRLPLNLVAVSDVQAIYQADLAFIYEEIKQDYLGLAEKETRFGFSWDEVYQEYLQKLDKIDSKQDFYLLANQFLAYLMDGAVSLSMVDTKSGMPPLIYDPALRELFDITLIQDQAMVVRASRGFPYLGWELVSINRVPMMDILDLVIRHLQLGSSDSTARAIAAHQKLYVDYFQLFLPSFPRVISLEFRDRNGRSETLNLEANRIPPSKPLVAANSLYLGSQEELNILYSPLENGVAYLQIPSFKLPEKVLKRQVKKAIQLMQESQVQGLVIDMRYNHQGDQGVYELLSYLTDQSITVNAFRYRLSDNFREAYRIRPLLDVFTSHRLPGPIESGYSRWRGYQVKPNRERFLTTIDVVVLVNEMTQNAAGLVANACRKFSLATLIGDDIHLSGHDLPVSVMLPSGEYQLTQGSREIRSWDLSPVENLMVAPDVLVSQKVSDFYHGVDSQLAAAVKYLQDQQ